MSRFRISLSAAAAAGLLVLVPACGDPDEQDEPDEETVEPFAEDCTVGVEPADDPEENRQNLLGAMIDAEQGDIVCLNEGEYELRDQLSLEVDGVEVRGESREGVRLDFEGQDAGANGIDVQNVEDIAFRSFTVANTPGNGIEVRNSDGVTFDDVAVEWEGEPSQDNGAYGLYPVKSENIVVENSLVYGASDAGIYLGQSEYGIIRHNEVHGNVAGIEVENSTWVDVYENEAYDNTGGILVFNLPELQRKEGELTRVFDNYVYDNNRENFADQSAIVFLVPPGSGVLVIAVQDIEIFDNDIENNGSNGVAIVSWETVPEDYDDDEYYPYAERVNVHSNNLVDNGEDPDGLATVLGAADIVWDGVYNDDVDEAERQNCFGGNDSPTYVNGETGDTHEDDPFELSDDCELESLDEVDF